MRVAVVAGDHAAFSPAAGLFGGAAVGLAVFLSDAFAGERGRGDEEEKEKEDGEERGGLHGVEGFVG
jgi:hypothetical protein